MPDTPRKLESLSEQLDLLSRRIENLEDATSAGTKQLRRMVDFIQTLEIRTHRDAEGLEERIHELELRLETLERKVAIIEARLEAAPPPEVKP